MQGTTHIPGWQRDDTTWLTPPRSCPLLARSRGTILSCSDEETPRKLSAPQRRGQPLNVVRERRLTCPNAWFCSADARYHFAASARFCVTPQPFSKQRPRFDCPSAWPWSAALASPPNHPHHANRPQQASRAPTVDTKRGYGRQRPRCNRVGEGDGCTDAGPQQTEHARTPRRASDQPWGPPKTTHQKTP